MSRQFWIRNTIIHFGINITKRVSETKWLLINYHGECNSCCVHHSSLESHDSLEIILWFSSYVGGCQLPILMAVNAIIKQHCKVQDQITSNATMVRELH